MARVELAPEVAGDIERILAHLEAFDSSDAAGRIAEIVAAIDALVHNPQIGRPREDGMRELVIGQGSHGYVVLYQYAAHADRVDVLAVRSQREAGYRLD